MKQFAASHNGAYSRFVRRSVRHCGAVDFVKLTVPAPRTVIEEQVSRIWSEVLGMHPVGIQDNFFDLGGDSLLAAQVILRVNETLDLSVQMRELFDSPTVAEFSRAVMQHLSAVLGDDELTALLSE